MIKHSSVYILSFFFLSLLFTTTSSANTYGDSIYTVKTIVIDPGHGGDKSGTAGAISLEKNVVLQVALKLGKAIEKEIPGVKVLYTRTTDVDVDLYKRIEFANEKKADLF